MAYGPKIIEEVRRSCRGVSGSAFTAAVYGWSHTLGIHVSTVYRWVGQDGRRSRRSDKGRRRVDVGDRALLKMMALTVRYGMTAETVIAQAVAHGWIAPQAISVATYNRMLRSRGVSLK